MAMIIVFIIILGAHLQNVSPRLKISGVASQFATQISGNLTSDLQFATQNYTQTNKICEELLYKLIFFDCVV
jgi:hypothetical protein